MKKALGLVLMALLAVSFSFAGGQKDTAQTAAQGPEYKIGIVFDVGGKGDKSFNDSAYQGLVRLAQDYKGYIKDDPDNVNFGTAVELKYLEPKSGGQDREQLLRVMAEDGYNLIFGVGFLFSDSLAKVAAEFPDTHFALIDGFIDGLSESSNITCLAFAEHEGSFLVGAAAGLKAGTSKVGFIGGMDSPLIHKFHGGFFAGALYANPALRNESMLFGQYIGKDGAAFNDPKTAESIAQNMFRQGASIIYHAAGASGTGLFKTASDMDKWAIGVDSDQGLVYATAATAEEKRIGEHILTSMLKRVDTSVYITAKEYMEGTIVGGYRTFSLADGGVGYAVNDYNKTVMADIIPQLEQIKDKIVSGEITVPDHDSQVREWAERTLR